ncbi:hypothetical protein GCM10023187_51900 [Nibrella viscosa]|uniref:Uncharacterized protein n=1 Tax=Nibrella viscosa TaxID=1084524 RepID=A0ABP8KZ41_9BACT
MTDQELDILLTDRCRRLDLRQKAIESFRKILADTEDSNENDFGGHNRDDIQYFFDGFEYHILNKLVGSVIRTRIGLYVEDTRKIWLGNLEPIGYYIYETDFSGNVLDDYCKFERHNLFL